MGLSRPICVDGSRADLATPSSEPGVNLIGEKPRRTFLLMPMRQDQELGLSAGGSGATAARATISASAYATACLAIKSAAHLSPRVMSACIAIAANSSRSCISIVAISAIPLLPMMKGGKRKLFLLLPFAAAIIVLSPMPRERTTAEQRLGQCGIAKGVRSAAVLPKDRSPQGNGL